MINFLVKFSTGRTKRVERPEGWTALRVRKDYERRGVQVKVLAIGDISHK